ncbi:hypothetical protein O3P69_011242 [Scylla paramamosain]|uniref:Uncharacterized protein n=1 Tax=Scylla paramamosain TaxID=85552 RepID=A0AAW0SUW4_SCYPA
MPSMPASSTHMPLPTLPAAPASSCALSCCCCVTADCCTVAFSDTVFSCLTSATQQREHYSHPSASPSSLPGSSYLLCCQSLHLRDFWGFWSSFVSCQPALVSLCYSDMASAAHHHHHSGCLFLLRWILVRLPSCLPDCSCQLMLLLYNPCADYQLPPSVSASHKGVAGSGRECWYVIEARRLQNVISVWQCSHSCLQGQEEERKTPVRGNCERKTKRGVMANTVEEEGEMEVNSQEQPSEMQDVGTSPEVIALPDNTPCQVDKCIDFVAVNQHGHLLMGSSSLTGRYWGGSLWYYDDPALAPDVEKCKAGYETTSGMADGAFLDNDKTVIVGQDCGAVQFMSVCLDRGPARDKESVPGGRTP